MSAVQVLAAGHDLPQKFPPPQRAAAALGRPLGGACKVALIPGLENKTGKRAWDSSNPPLDGITFTQVIAYNHVMKQLMMQSIRGQEGFSFHDHGRVRITHRQALNLLRGLQATLSPPKPGYDKLGFSEDMEISLTMGGQGLDKRHYKDYGNFMRALCVEARRIRRDYVVEQIGVVPEHVWKGSCQALCSMLVGGANGPSWFRDEAIQLCEPRRHAVGYALDFFGLSLAEAGYFRSYGGHGFSTDIDKLGRPFVFSLSPTPRIRNFDMYGARSLVSIYSAFLVCPPLCLRRYVKFHCGPSPALCHSRNGPLLEDSEPPRLPALTRSFGGPTLRRIRCSSLWEIETVLTRGSLG